MERDERKKLKTGEWYEIALSGENSIRALSAGPADTDKGIVYQFISKSQVSDKIFCFRMYDGRFSVHESLINPLPAERGPSFDVFVYNGLKNFNHDGVSRRTLQ